MHSPRVPVIGCSVLLGWLPASPAPSVAQAVSASTQDCSDWEIADGAWTGTFSVTTRFSSQGPFGVNASGEATVSGTLEMTQRAIMENTGPPRTVFATGKWKTASKAEATDGRGSAGAKDTGEGTLSGGRVVDPEVFRPGVKLRWVDWKASGSLAESLVTSGGDIPLEPLPADWPEGTLEFLVERVSCVEISGTVDTLPTVFQLAFTGGIQTNVASRFELRHHGASDFAPLSAKEDELIAGAQARLQAIGSAGFVATYASTEDVLRTLLAQVSELARAQPEFQLCLLGKLREWAAPVLMALLKQASAALRQAASSRATTWQNTHETVATALAIGRLGVMLGLDCAGWSTSQDQLRADIKRLGAPLVRAEKAAVEDLKNRESVLTEAQLVDGVATAERVLAEEAKLGAEGPDFDSAVKELHEALRALYRARIADPSISDAERARWRAALAKQGG